MFRAAFAALAVLMLAAAAQAQAPQQLPAQPTEQQPEKLPADEPQPGFQPIRPAGDEPAASQTPAPQPQAAPATTAPVVAPAAPAPASSELPSWAMAVLILVGAFLASLFGVLSASLARRAETKTRRRAAAATLATELETRRRAFEAVPLPPNIEAGVFFVSAITSLAAIDAGLRAAQADLHLLPGNLAASVSVHYAAVQRVADFVKGQSLAAAVRMLQANRIGGYPCPDAGTMREMHVELDAAFRGTDKLVAALRQLG